MKIADLKKEIESISGKTIAQLTKLAKSKVDNEGFYEEIKIKSGISVLWVSNRNYGQGAKNGYGIGLYAKLQMCGTGAQTVRLTELAI